MRIFTNEPIASGITCMLALAISACGGVDDVSPKAATNAGAMKTVASLPLPTTYSVVNLTANGWAVDKGINSTGQVAFRDWNGSGSEHAKFYDGSAIHDIGTLGGQYSIAGPLNDNGQIIGYSDPGDGQAHAFIWSLSTGITDIHGTSGTVNSSFGTAISNSGHVVGFHVGSSVHAFSWTQAGGKVDLGSLSGSGLWSVANSVNGLGQLVGNSMDANGIMHSIFWSQPTGIVSLDLLGGQYSRAIAINDAGLVTGISTTGIGYGQHAYTWTQAGGINDIDTLSGSFGFSAPIALSNAGHVVGYYAPPGAHSHAFVWTAQSGMESVGENYLYSFARAVNDSGHVVGHVVDSNSNTHAFVWTKSEGLIDLDTRISGAPPGLKLYEAIAISNNGAIVASSNVGLVLLKPGTVSNTAPTLGPITANDPIAVGSQVSVSALFSDADAGDSHTATWSWDNGTTTQPGEVSESNGEGSANATYTFGAAGVYPVSVTVTDNTGRSATVRRDVVVYDPSAGFVTGGGWFMSPVGAYKADTTLAGRATFGFVSKYKKGATTPTGNTEFQFQSAKLNFHSENYDWLVVAGARAQYKGRGTINGAGDYSFLLTAVDGNLLAKGTPDRFRIKIWHFDPDANADVVDYDNQVESSGEGTATEGTTVAGGSIVIQKN
ncbi:PKD domain-containing protein [Cupriavidus sp. AcVe19-6a]|uniref:PKD domain-containing protein n=1 Tax=Cupriavidus sp. AcVe19-6a TaxID=2821358 RepID=UPI001AEA645A|nr:PKD domain-containing protein [Cupriavidus sp. AcVe19-6a]MBP0639724.1 hypothetical protein [Cupriavidus sp. AcVe19-6a]